MTTAIATDLLTPLGAYLRLREGGRGSFLLESVEQGRLGRYSFVGAGTSIVDLDEAEALGLPVVGYLGYDHVAKLEPTVPLPDDGPGLPERRFVVADVLLRFDHARGVAEVLAGPPDLDMSGGQHTGRGAARHGSTVRSPDAETYMRGVERCQEHIRRGDAFQIV